MSPEPPRPQPKATLTLLCLLVLAVGAQSWSWSVLARHKREEMRRQRIAEREALEDEERDEEPDATPPEGKVLRLARTLDWAPRDPSLFLPRLFRDVDPQPVVELPTEDVDDDRLLSAFDQEAPSASAGIQEPPSEEPLGGATPTQTEGATLSATVPQPEDQETPKLLIAHVQPTAKRAHQDPLGASTSSAPSKRLDQPQPQASSEPASVQSAPSSSTAPSAERVTMKPVVVDEVDPDASWKARPRRVRKRGGVPLLSIEDPRGSMRHFFNQLKQAQSGRKVRVMHYGDSLIAGDYVTSTMRRLLQKRFGYGGVGYVLAGKPSPWYGRTGLKLKSKYWKADRATRSTSKLKSYGLGGVSFRSKSKRAYLRAEVEKQDQIDARVDTLELHYLAQPKGGQLSVRFGPTSEVVSTQAEELGPARVTIKAPPGLHKVELRPVGDGVVTLLGMSLERGGGGVVYDSLGLTGSRARQQLKWDRAHWSQQARWRRPDLFVLHYGTNESEDKRMSMSRYATVLRRVIQRHRSANPQASCLFVSPMDRAYRSKQSGRISTRPIIPKIVRTQREVALSEGCAFWSAYDAMGGWGSLKRWYRASPPLAGGDLTHPTRRGANLLGAMFFSAMMEAYAQVGGR